MTYYQQFPPAQDPYPYGPTQYAPAPPSRTIDIVATSMLIATHLGGYLLIAFFSMFWVMVGDSCGPNECDYDALTYAYVLTDLVGGIVLLVASIVAVVLMVRRKIAFWVPLVGILVQGVLLAISIGLLDSVVG